MTGGAVPGGKYERKERLRKKRDGAQRLGEIAKQRIRKGPGGEKNSKGNKVEQCMRLQLGNDGERRIRHRFSGED